MPNPSELLPAFPNLKMARSAILSELYDLALSIPASERQDFFDPRNRDLWMDSFINRLKARYQQPDRIASND